MVWPQAGYHSGCIRIGKYSFLMRNLSIISNLCTSRFLGARARFCFRRCWKVSSGLTIFCASILEHLKLKRATSSLRNKLLFTFFFKVLGRSFELKEHSRRRCRHCQVIFRFSSFFFLYNLSFLWRYHLWLLFIITDEMASKSVLAKLRHCILKRSFEGVIVRVTASGPVGSEEPVFTLAPNFAAPEVNPSKKQKGKKTVKEKSVIQVDPEIPRLWRESRKSVCWLKTFLIQSLWTRNLWLPLSLSISEEMTTI